MNEQVRETVERLEKLFQKVHEGLPEGRSYIRKGVAPSLTPREEEILDAAVSDEVARYDKTSSWSAMVRSDALYRTALWTKVAERIIAAEGSP